MTVRPLTRTAESLSRRQNATLLVSVLVIAICGLVYELLIGSLSSYLLGDSVTHFSITIGLFMSAMGVGSFLSRRVERDLLWWFLFVEIALALVGGFSISLLFVTFAYTQSYHVVMVLVIIVIGSLIGLEIPVLTRLAQGYASLKNVIADVFSLDYIGALVASVAFPMLLLPYLGLVKTAFLIGMFNLLVAIANLYVFRQQIVSWRPIWLAIAVVAALLTTGLLASQQITSFIEERLYKDEIIYAVQTPYQRLVVTRWNDDLRLFIDGNIQFSSVDEYRYHESLVHPAMSLAPSREAVLVLGGGDGLVAREALKYDDVGTITIVDIDPQVTDLFATYPPFVDLNQGALANPRVQVVNEDAYKFLERTSDRYPVVVIDLPDPNNESLAKLYSVEFYRLVKQHLARGGVVAVQSSSVYFTRETFWCTNHTIAAAGLHTLPYHAYVPSFGDWGFTLVSDLALDPARIQLTVPMRYLTPAILETLFVFDPDIAEVPTRVSTLDDAAVLHYYVAGWRKWHLR